jgi:hypothetical protein
MECIMGGVHGGNLDVRYRAVIVVERIGKWRFSHKVNRGVDPYFFFVPRMNLRQKHSHILI